LVTLCAWLSEDDEGARRIRPRRRRSQASSRSMSAP
jgi:hypothetical protein